MQSSYDTGLYLDMRRSVVTRHRKGETEDAQSTKAVVVEFYHFHRIAARGQVRKEDIFAARTVAQTKGEGIEEQNDFCRQVQ